MSFHIQANPEEISDKVLLPGDPLRAKYIAETFFENPKQFNPVRGMHGYTGTYKGKRVSVQPTGMGIPSTMIYVNELINEFGTKSMIRVGTCGGINKKMKLRDIILAQAASTDSGVLPRIFPNLSFAPCADFDLLDAAYHVGKSKVPEKLYVGNVLSTDTFYSVKEDEFKLWQDHNVLAAEMEASALYTLAAKNNVKALTILTVSDLIFDLEQKLSDKDKEANLNTMIEMALEVI